MRRFGVTAIAMLVAMFVRFAEPLQSLSPVAAAEAAGTPDYGNWGSWGNWSDFERDEHEDPADFATDAEYEYEPDDILAFNLNGASLAQVRKLGFHIVSRELLGHLQLELTRLRPPLGMTSRKALRKLREADPEGFYGFNPIYRLAGDASACEGLRCYGQSLIGWGVQSCGLHTRIGIVDSAVDLNATAFNGRKVQYRRLNRSAAKRKEFEHGTAIAAMLVGAPDSGFQGLTPDAELIAADVFSLDRHGEPFTDAAHLAKGLDWVAGFQPAAINISIAGPDGVVLRTAIRRVIRAGISIVAAAGNLGPRAPPQYPAAYPEVIAVTAIDRDLQVYAKANRGDYVALSAPGVGIWTAGPEGAGVFRDGTSFAAPFTTAAVALSRSQQPGLAPAAVAEYLKTQARDLGQPGFDPIYGAGLVQTPSCTRVQHVALSKR